MGYEIGSKRGVANHYGPRGTDGQYGGQDNSVGKIKKQVGHLTMISYLHTLQVI